MYVNTNKGCSERSVWFVVQMEWRHWPAPGDMRPEPCTATTATHYVTVLYVLIL